MEAVSASRRAEGDTIFDHHVCPTWPESRTGDLCWCGPYPGLPGSNTTRAAAELDFHAAPVAEALQDVVQWFTEERPESPLYAGSELELSLADQYRVDRP
jgi:hypothetical protein